MSFADEFKAMKSGQGAPKETAGPEEAPAEAPATDDAPDGGYEPFAQSIGAVEGDEPAAAAPEAPPAPSQGRKVEIKIGGKVFTSEKEALDYANELEMIRLEEEAYKRGQEAAKPKTEAPPEPKKIRKIAEKIFENPEDAFEELETYINEQTEARIRKAKEEEIQAAQQEQQVKKTWEDFYKNNSDLSGFDAEVNQILQREWHRLGSMKSTDALNELAIMTRAYISSMKEKLLPKQVLSSKPAMSAGVSNQTTATAKSATKEKDDFISQVKKARRGQAVQSEA